MNKFLIIWLVLCSSLTFGQGMVTVRPKNSPDEPTKQNAVANRDTIYFAANVDIKPEFPGGLNEFYKSFGAEFKIPAEKPDLQGRIFVRFIVEKDGELTNIRVLRELGVGTGAEAVRVIRKLPKWKPAQYQGKAVRCDYSLPISIPYNPSKGTSNLKVKEILDKN